MWIENLEIIILQYVHLLDENCLRAVLGSNCMEIEFVKEEWNDLNEDNKSWIIN